MSPPHILASISSSRRKLLANAGIKFEVVPSGIDEDEVKRSLAAERATPQSVAETLAELKALSVSALHGEAMVIGADQTLACNGRLFDKPPTVEAARKQLMFLRGQAAFYLVFVDAGGHDFEFDAGIGQKLAARRTDRGEDEGRRRHGPYVYAGSRR
jgi:predicted house-cleaning NTP pyrophosphatase (Maf/HAM1 superfamily)